MRLPIVALPHGDYAKCLVGQTGEWSQQCLIVDMMRRAHRRVAGLPVAHRSFVLALGRRVEDYHGPARCVRHEGPFNHNFSGRFRRPPNMRLEDGLLDAHSSTERCVIRTVLPQQCSRRARSDEALRPGLELGD